MDAELRGGSAPGSLGQRFDRRRGQTFGVTLALCCEVNNPLGDHQGRPFLNVRKSKSAKSRVVSDIQPGDDIEFEHAALLAKHPSNRALMDAAPEAVGAPQKNLGTPAS
jgi:hypothetical protein